MNKGKIIGIDLAKTHFYLFTLDKEGNPAGKKRLSRGELLRWLAQQTVAIVALEACDSAHYWAREIQALGHQVLILPAQHVKAYRRKQKNDYNDAQAIAEACQHGTIRSVRVKSLEQQDEQTFLKMRRRVVEEKTQLINHIRGLLADYGIILKQGASALHHLLPSLLEDGDPALTPKLKILMQRQYARFVALEQELIWYDSKLRIQVKKNTVCQRLQTIPGFGPLVSQLFKVWIGDGQQFRRGRDASAALGLVPRQFSTGGRQILLSITKCGDSYIRAMLIQGARSVVSRAANKTDALSLWINRLREKRGFNRTVVALANKLTRIAWAIISR
ncbi:transposase [Xenorhabdus vietnamensis]|uniref:Transposase n=1 Tax=Xenorhabdus vietnamensis TaxID=351656 RepID=A0A1Y2S6Q0_9GAMM|nr:IS110 family transposase [Xenorhabdus vietnamensis]OTA14328.1 transposase [Xenorhabdus vietnamensis]